MAWRPSSFSSGDRLSDSYHDSHGPADVRADEVYDYAAADFQEFCGEYLAHNATSQPALFSPGVLPYPTGYPYRVYVLGELSGKALKLLRAKIAALPDVYELVVEAGEDGDDDRPACCADLAQTLQRHREHLQRHGLGVEWPVSGPGAHQPGQGQEHPSVIPDRIRVLNPSNSRRWRPSWTKTFLAVDEEAVRRDSLTSARLRGLLVRVDSSAEAETHGQPVGTLVTAAVLLRPGSDSGIRTMHYERFPDLVFNQTVENLERLMASDRMDVHKRFVSPHWLLG